ncbi:MAG: choice-of-anchor D domain-containing protein [Nevskia sp.]|nr:choice-of-anchor D domain-containing protein [Nevskia sp.]
MSVAAADFNGDGRPDLLVANIDSNTVSVLLNRLYPVTVSGNEATATIVNDDAPLQVSPGQLNFGNQTVNTASAAKVVTLSNAGGTPLSISSITTTGNFRHTTTCGASLAPSGRCTISIVFSPTAAGTRTGSTRIISNAVSSPDLINLSGTGRSPMPGIMTNISSFNFGSIKVGKTSVERALTITSSGTGPLEIRSISLSGDYTGSHNCPRVLNAGRTCTLTGRFKPKAKGSRPGKITITTDAPGGTTVITLAGNGT